MRRDVTEIDSHEKVETALTRLQENGSKTLPGLQENGSKTLPVTQDGQLVGLITSESIKKFLMIHSALRTAGGMA